MRPRPAWKLFAGVRQYYIRFRNRLKLDRRHHQDRVVGQHVNFEIEPPYDRLVVNVVTYLPWKES